MNHSILCKDALLWLEEQPDHSLDNIITGIPDMNEVDMSMEDYTQFFIKAVQLIFQKVKPVSYVIFMVTDRKYKGTWFDKSFLIQQHASSLKWHKIILLRDVGKIHIQRPTYQHYLCFSASSGPGNATPDVIYGGKRSYANGACLPALEHAVSFIKRYAPHQFIIDPFVGRGSTLQEAKKQNIPGLGIDLNPTQCEFANKNLCL